MPKGDRKMRKLALAFYVIIAFCLFLSYTEILWTSSVFDKLNLISVMSVWKRVQQNVPFYLRSGESGAERNSSEIVVHLTSSVMQTNASNGSSNVKPEVIEKVLVEVIYANNTKSLPSVNVSGTTSNSSQKLKRIPPFFDPHATSHLLLNLTDFKWLKNNESICVHNDNHVNRGGNDWSKILLIMFHTSRKYVANREVVRNSWASVKRHGTWSVRMIFLIGLDNPAENRSKEEVDKEDKALDEEELKYGDLVMGNFIDTYQNLSYKHLMGYKWVLEYCQNADFVLKVDDDMFIDVPKFIKYREMDLNSGKTPEPNMYCTFMGGEPIRTPGTRWYVSEDVYPDKEYPIYCSGSGYGTTVDMIYKLYSVHRMAKYVWVDDAFVTGILMTEAKKRYNDSSICVEHGLVGVVQNPQEYMTFCDQLMWNGTRTFNEVTSVPRDEDFGRNMNCLWKIAKLDHAGWVRNKTVSLIGY